MCKGFASEQGEKDAQWDFDRKNRCSGDEGRSCYAWEEKLLVLV